MTAWTDHPQWHKGHLYLWKPDVVLAAQVDAATMTERTGGRFYPTDTWWLIKIKDTTVGSWANVEGGQTVLLGSTAGGRDYGVARVISRVADATLGLCIGVWAPPGRKWGELDVQTDLHLTVLDLRQVWAKLPHVLDDGSIRKDGYLSYTVNTPPPPVANAGVAYAGDIDATTSLITVSFDATGSYAVADGASITGYVWDVADGTITVGTSTSSTITATFPPGQRYVRLTVSDSNGKSASAWVPVVGVGSYTPTASEVTYTGTAIASSDHFFSFLPGEAFDDDPYTHWMALNEDVGAWVGFVFDSPQTISKAGWYADQTFDANTPKSAVLEADTTGDGIYDTVAYTWTDMPNDDTEHVGYFSPITAARWRLRITAVYYDGSAPEGRDNQTFLTELNLYTGEPVGASEVEAFEIVSRTLRTAGQSITFRVYSDIDAADYPYGTLVLYWEDEYYGSAQESLYGPTGREHMRFVGWIDNEPTRIDASDTGTRAYVELQCVDVAGRLAQLPVFPMGLMRTASPSNFDEMADLNPDRYAWFILHWHSTALELADFNWSGTLDDNAIPLLATQGDSLYSQADYMAQAIAHRLTCDSRGRLAMLPDPQLQAVASRTSTVMQALTANDWMNIQYTEQRPSRYHWLWGGAIVASTSDAADVSEVESVFCRAPGSTPGQGLGMVRRSEQVVADQAALNVREGMRYAVRLNPDQSFFDVPIAHGNDGGIEPAYMQWVTLTLSAAQAAQRGLNFTAARFLPFEVTIEYNHATRTKTARLRLEREASGPPAVTYVPGVGSLVNYDTNWYTGAEDQPGGLYGDLAAARNEIAAVADDGAIYVTRNFKSATPEWSALDLTFSGTMQQFVVDAFSPGYVDGSGAINGWVVTSTGIYRVSDIFGSAPAATLQHTFRTPSGSIANHSINASFGSAGHVVVVSYYGADGTWATYTTDGTTWATEAQITSHYQSNTATYATIFPGVYVSSKTAGLVYTSAFKSAGVGAGYVSTDYGATWTETNGTNGPVLAPGAVLAADIHVPFAHADELRALYGAADAGSATASGWYLGPELDRQAMTGTDWWNSLHLCEVLADDAYMLAIFFEGLVRRGGDAIIKRDICTSECGTVDHCFTYATSDYFAGSLDENGDLIVLVGSQAAGNELFGAGNFIYKDEDEDIRWSGTLASPIAGPSDLVSAVITHLGWAADSGTGGFSAGDVYFKIVYNVNSPNSLASGTGYVTKRADGANNTDLSPQDASSNPYGPYGRSHWRIKTSPTDESRVLAVVNREGDTGARVWLSTNSGSTWLARTADNSAYRRGSIAGDDPNVLYVWGASGAIAVSADSGMSWEDKQGNLSSGEIVGICGGTS